MEAPVKFELVDINEILKTLPHRYPMLLIDRVTRSGAITAASASRMSLSTSRHSLVIFRIARSNPGVMMIEAMRRPPA